MVYRPSRDLIVFCGGVGSTLASRWVSWNTKAPGVFDRRKLEAGNAVNAVNDHHMQGVGVMPQPRQEHESRLTIAQKYIDTNLDYVAQALEKESLGGRIALVGHSLGGYQAARLAYLLVRGRSSRPNPRKITCDLDRV